MFRQISVLNKQRSVRSYAKDILDKSDKLAKLCKIVCDSKKDDCGPFRPIQKAVPLTPPEACSKHTQIQFMDIRCKTAIVTGGASGLGYEAVKALLKEGAMNVIIADCNRQKGEKAASQLNFELTGDRAQFIPCDVTLELPFNQLFESTIARHKQVDILINCIASFDETPDCWHTTVDINLLSTVRGTVLGYQYMSQNQDKKLPKGGCILNISSFNSLINFPTTPVFSSAAGGINGLSSSFGADKHYKVSNVRCLALCPGSTMSYSVFSREGHYDPIWAAHSEASLKCPKPQPTAQVARAMMHVIKYGTNGSIYAVSDNKFLKYNLPNYKEILRQEAILL